MTSHPYVEIQTHVAFASAVGAQAVLTAAAILVLALCAVAMVGATMLPTAATDHAPSRLCHCTRCSWRSVAARGRTSVTLSCGPAARERGAAGRRGGPGRAR